MVTFASLEQAAENSPLQLLPIESSLTKNISIEEATTIVNTSNALQIECDGEKYGMNPDEIDCQNARTFYKPSTELFTYGERHTGQGPNVFPLPFRLMGSMSLQFFFSFPRYLYSRALR